jgi:hypothetical protein
MRFNRVPSGRRGVQGNFIWQQRAQPLTPGKNEITVRVQ